MGQCVSGEALDSMMLDDEAMAKKRRQGRQSLPSGEKLQLRQAPLLGPKNARATVKRDLHWTSSRGSRSS